MLRVGRFLSAYLRHPAGGAVEEEVRVPLQGGMVPATLFRPPGNRTRPGWVALHGITVPGRRHPSLLRFAHALARSGNLVLIPEIRPWMELRVEPNVADRVIGAAAEYLATRGDVEAGGVGVVGFSFGATQALITATHPELRNDIRAVVGFGGFCDLHRAIHFMFTGEHEWDGVQYRLAPDPYGRWIVAANYLPHIPEYADMQTVARAATVLATEAGRRAAYAADALYDPLKADLRRGMTPREQALWDLIAPPAHTTAPREPLVELATALADAALRVHPDLDPRPVLPRLDRRVVLAHGYHDRLIPFTELLRLRSLLPRDADVFTSVTRLFAHSRGAEALPPYRYPLEALRYFRLLSRALRT